MAASDYILDLEERCFKANQNALYLLKMAQEVDTLKAYVIDLKSRVPKFVPTKGDEIDAALAEYINALPNRN